MAGLVCVLVIDDSPEDQETLRRCLRRCGGDFYQVAYEDSAEGGLAAVQQLQPDVILLDYLLPDLDGIEFVRELKASIAASSALGLDADPGSPSRHSQALQELVSQQSSEASEASEAMLRIPPIIMLTGQGSEQVAVEAMKEGVADYLVKGELTPHRLHQTIQRAIEQHNLRRSLELSEERFRASVETMLDSFGTYVAERNAQGQIVGFQTEYINEAACDRANIILSQKTENLYVIEPPQWTEELFQEYCQLVETGVPIVKEITVFDTEIQDKTAPESIQFAYDLRATRLGDGFVAVWREITGKKRAELERSQLLAQEQQARAAAEEANQLKDAFMAMVSHDLKTPLNSIQGWVQMLKRNPSEKTLKQATEIIERSANSQLSLIDDLLDLSRILRGSLAIVPQRLNFVTILDAAIQTFHPLLSQKQLQLYCDVHGDTFSIENGIENGIEKPNRTSDLLSNIPPIMGQGDLNRLNQVLGNLISNAIKFTPEGGQIRFGLSPVGQHVRISVSDSGIGIEPEQLELVFERFHQSKQEQRTQGLGLGLSIARHIVELHRGRIWAESQGPGQGATFTIELPMGSWLK